MDYKDRTRVINLIGIPILLIGLLAIGLGPAELYCFYLFSEGGPFHYPGFGFGSFMFGNIAIQIVGYYVIAAVFIPLGYGHLKCRRWTRPLVIALLYAWLVVGAPLAGACFLILAGSKDLGLPMAVLAAALLAASYLLVPGLLLRFYNSQDVRLTFKAKDHSPSWLEIKPTPVLVLAILQVFYLVVFHIPILFRGLFPAFGVWVYNLPGILLYDGVILVLALLAWSTLKQRSWSWWGSLVLFGLLTISTIVTLCTSSFADILSILSFPPTEMEFLAGVPLQGYHLAVPVGIPLLLTMVAIIRSRPYYAASNPVSGS
jgi:hypothetical protein